MTKTFEGLNKSEIRKAEKMANILNHSTDCKVTGCFYKSTPDEIGFIEVFCEICHSYSERAEYDVTVQVFMDDRRRSYAHSVLSQTSQFIAMDNYKEKTWERVYR